ncbi:hypothetical protein ONZ51_g3456 [Trametes cubensis]|uniref:Fungal-type protein kinase domain-containing protein n=1 Tax=Trametes cubensis TaxID=1111947 RepID=A0AAD7U026_9APHY|nr:hypothetical protein ONZ51_g3456 [Trametes cubensis]
MTDAADTPSPTAKVILPKKSAKDSKSTGAARPGRRTIVDPKKLSSSMQNEMPPSSTGNNDARAIARNRRAALAREMHWVTFSSASDWLDTCLPGEDVPDTIASTLTPFNVTVGNGENAMYPGLCQGFNSLLQLFKNEDFLMKVTSEHPDTTALGTVEGRDKEAMRPDLVMYPRTKEAEELYKVDTRKSKLGGQGEEEAGPRVTAAHVGRTVWAHAEFVIEAKHDPKLAPFSFTPGEDQTIEAFSEAADREDARGQLIAYAREICARQHRRYVYLISVYRNCARFIRVDRTAALLSAPFDYVQDPMLFATFIYRYINATPEERGYDPTATRATKEECQLFSDVIANYTKDSHLYAGLQNAVKEGWPIFKLSIRGPWSSNDGPVRIDSPEETRVFLVGRPAFRSHSMTGRGTRGFFAYDVARKRIVFVKDYWRADLPGHLTEYDVYIKLSGGDSDTHNFFPTLLGGGDVRSNDSEEVQQTLSDKCAKLPVTGRVHVRLVMKEVCRRLQTFKDWRELVSVMRDALIAHKIAWEEYGILHRDVSVGNILIYELEDGSPERKVIGLLTDWDLAKTKDQIFHPVASQSTRSGTWQFLSAALSRNPEKPHLVSDDLESAMHVLNWLTLKHMHTHLTDAGSDEVAVHIHNYYDAQTPAGLGSILKWVDVTRGAGIVDHHDHSPNHPFIYLLNRLAALCAEHYSAQPVKDIMNAAKAGTLADLCSKATPPRPPPLTGDKLPLLNNHQAFIDVFEKALKEKTWPVLEKLADQVPDVEPTSSSIGSKRPATDDSDSDVGSGNRAKKARTTTVGRKANASPGLSGSGSSKDTDDAGESTQAGSSDRNTEESSSTGTGALLPARLQELRDGKTTLRK